MSNSILKYAIGADVSQEKIDVCFKKIDFNQDIVILGARKFTNTPSGLKAFAEWITKKRKVQNVPLSVVMEATGVYHEKAADYLHTAGFKVVVVLPNQSTAYLKSLNVKSKTDAIDAKGLAQMGIERKMRAWEPPNPHMRQLRNMTRQKNALQKMKTSTRNQLHAHKTSAYPSQEVLNQLEIQIDFFKVQIAQIEQHVEQLLNNAGEFGQKVEKITNSMHGIGIASVAAIIAELNGLDLFNSQSQVISFSGYDVVQNQSGKHKGKSKISKKGNSHIRKALHFPALNVVRYNVGPFKSLYDRVFDRTKIKMKGYVAVQRKLLCIIYHLWKSDTVFDPNYQQNKKQELEVLKTQVPFAAAS